MKYAFVNGLLLDGSADMQPRAGLALLTEGARIREIVPCRPSYEGYEVVDLKGQYLMPGLINLHVHLPASGKPHKKLISDALLVHTMTSTPYTRHIVEKLCAANALTQLMSGVTTLRTMGGVQDMDTAARDKIAAGLLDGPRILAANMAVSVPGGHMAGSLAYPTKSAAEARACVELIAKDLPDQIKLMITGGVLDAKVKGEPGVLKMPAEYVKAACDEAHRRGLKVAAHAESPQGVKVALENGVDTIEHGAAPDEEMLELFRLRGAALVATISPALPYALFDPEVSRATETERFNGRIVFDGIIACAKACLENGIPVGLGTDTGCPFITHYDMWREVNYFHKYCGVSRAFALHTATQGNARIAGLGSETGTLAPGFCADLLVTPANPLEDLRALRSPAMVMARGRLYRQPAVKKMPQVERELDQFL